MDLMNIRIIGSGSQKKINKKENEHQIYCNASVVRGNIDTRLHDFIFITDGVLLTDEELKKCQNAKGLNTIESFNIRRAKRISLHKRHVRNLLVVSNKNKHELHQRIKNIGVSYESLVVLSSHAISVLLFRYMGLRVILTIFKYGFKPTLFYLISLMLPIKFKPPVSVRPSTGMVAYLWVTLNLKGIKDKVILDGIGNSIEAHYPCVNDTQVKKYAFNQVHTIDTVLYNNYIKQK
ncbi:hypothetical protein JCM14469_19700 [Desulfatiferula olefinivorans]